MYDRKSILKQQKMEVKSVMRKYFETDETHPYNHIMFPFAIRMVENIPCYTVEFPYEDSRFVDELERKTIYNKLVDCVKETTKRRKTLKKPLPINHDDIFYMLHEAIQETFELEGPVIMYISFRELRINIK